VSDANSGSDANAGGGTSPNIPVVQNGGALIYQRKVQEFTTQATELGNRSRLVSNFRGLSFGVVVIATIGALTDESPVWSWLLLGSIVTFAALIAAHARVIRREELALRRLQVNAAALKRVSGAFRELPDDGAEFRNPLHPCADDLDLFGKASLFQLINRAHTRFGQRRLSSFLMNRCPPSELLKRQAAVQELASLIELRQELEALALASAVPLSEQQSAKPVAANSQTRKVVDPEPLLAWAESEPKLLQKPVLAVLSKILPVFTCAYLAWAMYHGWHALTWVGPLVVQGILLATAQAYTGAVFAAVSSHQGAFLRYGPMLALLEQTQAKSELLVDLKRATETDGLPPSARMRQFERIVGWFELRHNGLVYPIINLVLMWDFHCVFALERWQKSAGKQVRAWFNTLGELEALSSFAGFAYDNPKYAWPKVVGDRTCFVASELGHPLILKGRVNNDVDLEHGGRALLVTGSNMSGKSTLMRAIGINAVLAQAGAPVCARELTMGSVSVRTSMRMSDSLEQGVSHFYAELHKLKAVLDARHGEVPVLFLLDEVLHGTNSRERQIGARWVLAELLRANAIGAVSTHDSGLCTLPEPLMSAVQQVHLREIAEGSEMTFDYKLRPGPVQSGNALRLMRSLGIGVPLQDDTVAET
jgi:hypothetical protein